MDRRSAGAIGSPRSSRRPSRHWRQPVEPPAYTRLAVANLADPSRIDAWEGSRVTLNVTASRPVTAIDVVWPAAVENAKATPATPGSRKVAATRSADGKSGTATLAAEASGSFAVTLRDAHGLNSRPEAEAARRVIVRFDAAPVVALAGPDAAHESSPADVLTLRVAARDDVAVASVELHYTIDRRRGQASSAAAMTQTQAEPESGHVAVALPGLGTRAARARSGSSWRGSSSNRAIRSRTASGWPITALPRAGRT